MRTLPFINFVEKARHIVISYLTYQLSADVHYQGLTNKSLMFDANTHERMVNIPIYITNGTKLDFEEFMVTLSYSEEDVTRVSLEPQNARVKIFKISGTGIFN